MTRELLQEANKLNHAISYLDAQIRIVEDIHHVDSPLQISCNGIGAVTLDGFDELKDDIIDMVLNHLNNKKEALEDQFRMM